MTIDELLIYGITIDRNYKKQIDYYTVTEKPGFSGPEVVSKDSLGSGTLFQIKRAMNCTNCLDVRTHFEIEILSEEKYQDHTVRIGNISIKHAKEKK